MKKITTSMGMLLTALSFSIAAHAVTVEIKPVEIKPIEVKPMTPVDVKGQSSKGGLNFGAMNQTKPAKTNSESASCSNSEFCTNLSDGLSGSAFQKCMHVLNFAQGAITVGGCKTPSTQMAKEARQNLIDDEDQVVTAAEGMKQARQKASYGQIKQLFANGLVGLSVASNVDEATASAEQLGEYGPCKYVGHGAVAAAVNAN
ncbi:MAG: hypothetical protein ACXVA9_12825 [Bdellovibrionales bacterium]